MAQLGETPRTRPGTGYREYQKDTEPKPLNREQGILGLFQAAAFGISFVSQPNAAALILHGPNIAKAGAELAANDVRARKLIDRILQTGPYGAFLAAVAPLAMQIAANSGLIEPGMGGTMTKDELMTVVGATQGELSENGHGPTDTGSAGISN